MAVAYDNATASAPGANGTTYSFAHTVGSGSNRAIYVSAYWNNDPGAISAATYGGVAMTELVSKTAGTSVHKVYRLLAPASGANNVVLTWTNSRTFTGCAVSFENVNQTTPEGTIVTEESGDEVISVTAGSAGMILDFLAQLGSTDLTPTDPPLTARAAVTGFLNVIRIEAATAAGTGSAVTCTWTSTANSNSHVGIPVETSTQNLTQALESALTLTDAIATQMAYAVGLASSVALSEILQAAHTDLNVPAENFTDPTELGSYGDWEDQDLAPGDTPVWSETARTPVTWTQADSDLSGTPLTPIECAETLSDMFCDRDYPPFVAPTDCTIFSPVVVTAGSVGRLAQHSVEEIPGTTLVVGLASPGSTPHDTVATVELVAPYSSATKNTLEATNPTFTEGVGRMNPFTKSFVAMYPFLDGSDRLVRYQSVPWDGSAYNYAGVVSDDVDIPNSGDGADFRSFGLVPLKDGRWLSCYDDTTSDKLYWNYSEDDGETWSAFTSQAIGEGLATFLLLCADGIPIIVYSTAIAGTPALYARALVDNTWGTALQIDDAIANNQAFSLAAISDSKRFQVFYNENGATTVKVKFCTVTGQGTLALASTETVASFPSTGFAGVWATYHPVATAGAKWIVLVSTTDGNVNIYKRLDTTGASWSTTALGAISNPGFMLPAIPRCAASLPIFQWISGNTITIRRVAS